MGTLPDSSAVPGIAVPGSAQPGNPPASGGGGGGLTAVFTGTETLTYPQYMDAQTMRTLVASPGGTYGITVASGYVNVGSLPDDGRWIPQGN